MIDGMTQAHSKDRWVLDEGESGTNSVLNTLNKELQHETFRNNNTKVLRIPGNQGGNHDVAITV
ncbi:Uncharacterized protein APZ42_016126 [Daphnia magna]|uniref:Uncharacterized protein n=1 Tax=Daphnia magna TaxID=35525 RepID=A0A162NL17_9CRUS|nr:Uncharacterized protein APZ42_016126 [Daphnia magna]